MSRTVECEPNDMTCALCQEVFRSPRFLEGCYHSFCCRCIDSNAKALGSRTVTCPICRVETTLLEGGASSLQVNFYYKEETLEEARKLLKSHCPLHAHHRIDRVCLTCQTPACKKCKEHKAKGHKVHQLSQGQRRMEAQVKDLEEKLAYKRRELLNIQAKTSALSRQMRHQRDLLHAHVEQQFKTNNNGLWTICRKFSEKLSEEISFLQEAVQNSRNLRSLTQDCVERGSGLNVVDVAKRVELRLVQGVDMSSVNLSPVVHPGLVCSLQNDVEPALSCFLGQPTEHVPPQQAEQPPSSVEDIKIPVKMNKPKEVREILRLMPSHDGKEVMICFRGSPAHLYSSVAMVQIQEGIVLAVDHDVLQGKVVCMYRHYEQSPRQHQPVILKTSHFGVFQVSKVEPRMCLFRDKLGFIRLHQLALQEELEEQPWNWQIAVTQPETGTRVMHVDVVDPYNMDVSSDQEYCVIIDGEGSMSQSSHLVPPKKTDVDDDVDFCETSQSPSSKKRSFEEEDSSETPHPSLSKKAKFHNVELCETSQPSTFKKRNFDEVLCESSQLCTSKQQRVKKDETSGKHDQESATNINQRIIRQPLCGAVVKLFRRGQTQPVDVYHPAKSSFLPSDVCFCRWKKRRLLVADWQNDEIHVVQVGKKGFRFKCLLAERHGELVKPSALNTDLNGGVWIGCNNGSVLRWPAKC